MTLNIFYYKDNIKAFLNYFKITFAPQKLLIARASQNNGI